MSAARERQSVTDEPRRAVSDWWFCAGVFIVYLPLVVAYGLWTLDQLGLEQWTAKQIGQYAAMVVDAYRAERTS